MTLLYMTMISYKLFQSKFDWLRPKRYPPIIRNTPVRDQ